MVCLHGWTCDGSDWAWLSADLGADHRLVIPDLRGHGRSSRGDGKFGPLTMAGDVAGLLDQLGLEGAVVLGHSMGTLVASALAVERPELVRALVLVDPVYGQTDESGPRTAAAIASDPYGTAELIFSRFEVVTTPPWLAPWHRRRLLGTPAEVLIGALASMADGDEAIGLASSGAPYLARRSCPVLSIYAGDGGTIAEFEASLPHGPHDAMEFWEEAGHFLHQEQPARFSARVRAFLATLDDA